MTDKIYNVLFPCTGNSSRSIMTESLFNKIFRQIMSRMDVFVNLPLHALDDQTIKLKIKAIGEIKV